MLDQKFNEWEVEQEKFEALENAFEDFLKRNDFSEDEEAELRVEFLSDPEDFFKEW